MKTRHFFAVLSGLLLVAFCAAVVAGPAFSVEPEPLPKAKVDYTMNPGDTVTIRNKTPLIGHFLSSADPNTCRGVGLIAIPPAPLDQIACRVYRIKLNRNPDPDAENTVFIHADFDQVRIPSPNLIAVGYNPPPLNGINVDVWDKADHYLGEYYDTSSIVFPNAKGDPNDIPTGTHTYNSPEVGAFNVRQDIYDIIVANDLGVNNGFTLTLRFSDEIFEKPFEVLDPTGTGPVDDGSDVNSIFDNLAPQLPIDSSLAELPVNTDSDIAKVGLGTDEFNPQALVDLQRGSRNVSAVAKAPSALILILAMVVFPLALGLGGVVIMRRRRHALF